MNDTLFWLISLNSIFLAALRNGNKSRNRHMPTQTGDRNTKQHSNKVANNAGKHSTTKTEEEVLYGKLLSMVMGDRGVADRLIEYERKRFPIETRSGHIQRAIDALRWARR